MTLTSATQNAEEDKPKNLYKYSGDGCWPGIDSAMVSYYEFELGKLCLDTWQIYKSTECMFIIAHY